MNIAVRTSLVLLLLAFGCDDDPTPPPPPIGPTTFSPGGVVAPVGGVSPPGGTTFATDGDGDGGTVGDATATGPVTPGPATDGADDVDTIAEVECRSTCDCPPLTRCTADGCLPTSQLLWCCSEPTCPSGEECETPRGVPGTCP